MGLGKRNKAVGRSILEKNHHAFLDRETGAVGKTPGRARPLEKLLEKGNGIGIHFLLRDGQRACGKRVVGRRLLCFRGDETGMTH